MSQKNQEPKTNSVVDKLKKMHSARAIEQKDFSLKDLFPAGTESVDLEVIGLASKFVPKYCNENNAGYHTMIYLKDGKKTGAFSNALFEFARFFYEGVGLDLDSTFNKVEFANGGFLKVRVSEVPLDKKKSTYNFEIVEGEINGFSRMGKLESQNPLLIAAGAKEVVTEE
jgi:hypothetical protein